MDFIENLRLGLMYCVVKQILNMADYTHNVTSIVPVTEPIFQASPSSITIREFQPQTTIQVLVHTMTFCLSGQSVVCMPACLPVCLFAYMSVRLIVCPPVCLL